MVTMQQPRTCVFVLMLQLGCNGDLSKISEKSSLVGSHFLCNGLVGNEQQVAEGMCIECPNSYPRTTHN